MLFIFETLFYKICPIFVDLYNSKLIKTKDVDINFLSTTLHSSFDTRCSTKCGHTTILQICNFIINHILKQVKDRGDCKVIDRCFRLVNRLFIDLNTFLHTLYIALAAALRALGSRLTGYNGFNLNFDFRGIIRNSNCFYTFNICFVITVKLGAVDQSTIQF